MNALLLFGIDSSTNELSPLGFLWLPFLALVYFSLNKKGVIRSTNLLLPALAVILGFFLTRSWVSEQNLNFVLPLVLLSSARQNWSRKWVSAAWLLPLIFTVLHTLPPSMLFLSVPPSLIDYMLAQLQLVLTPEVGRVIRALITLVWLIVGLSLFRKSVHEAGPALVSSRLTGSSLD
jgi:hypothetical protein